jgi:hypothetical protein
MKTSPALLEAIRTEYITGPDRPSLDALAKKYGVGSRQLKALSSRDGWVSLRDAYSKQVAEASTRAAHASAAAAVAGNVDARDRSAEILRFVRDGLTQALRETIKRLVTSRGMSEKEVAEVMARWEDMAAKDMVRFLAQGPQALASVVKALELVEGRPTERHDVKLPAVPMSEEDEELVHRLWDQVKVDADSD